MSYVKNNNMNTKIVCPECKNDIEIENPVVGMVVECPACGVEIELTKVDGDNIEFIIIEDEK